MAEPITATDAYVYPLSNPDDYLEFALFPDENEMSGGSNANFRSLPDLPYEVSQGNSLNSVEFSHSLVFDDQYIREVPDMQSTHGAAYAKEWIKRHLGNKAPIAKDRLFVIRIESEPIIAKILKWSAKVMQFENDGNQWQQVRFQFSGKEVTPVKMNLAKELVARAGKRRAKGPKPATKAEKKGGGLTADQQAAKEFVERAISTERNGRMFIAWLDGGVLDKDKFRFAGDAIEAIRKRILAVDRANTFRRSIESKR